MIGRNNGITLIKSTGFSSFNNVLYAVNKGQQLRKDN